MLSFALSICSVLFFFTPSESSPYHGPVAISHGQMQAIAEKIWYNECAGTFEGLTCWNRGENFGSFGIGHFIWYPIGCQDPFRETFPTLIAFLKANGASVPLWIAESQGCPWYSREDFYRQIDSPEMVELRQFLFDSRELQAMFIVAQLQAVLPNISRQLAHPRRHQVVERFNRLLLEPQGIYAMVDYLNFKGLGTLAAENYDGQGWGLLQVLMQMSSSDGAVSAFVAAAKKVLTQRVRNAPPERNEERWLPGWFKRLETYL
jgi:hypothetical protein